MIEQQKMTLERLNQCLYEMDNLTHIFTDYNALTLSLVFNCYKGGYYENVTLSVVFKYPALFNLPFCASGNFKILELGKNEITQRIPYDYLETNPTVFVITVNDKDEGFYVACDQMEWSVSGSGTQNQHELLKH